MSVITDEFERICKENEKRIAFYYEKAGVVKSKTYKELYEDVEKAESCLVEKGIGNGKKLLAFASPNYDLLVCILAAFKLGAAVMYVDIFAKQDSLKNFFNKFKPDYALVSNKTRFLSLFFKHIRKARVVNVDKFSVGSAILKSNNIDDNVPALITATTGSSGQPKVFIRSHGDLFNQLKLIRNNLKVAERNEVILTTSYIYAFANLIQGFTTVLPNINLALRKRAKGMIKKLKKFENLKITTIMTSPDFCLRLPNLYSEVKRLYFGGAILNYNESSKIKSKYDGAEIWYIYGSTECALISGVRLEEYLDILKKTGRCLLGNICDGVKVCIDGDGHILVNSDALLRQKLDGKTTGKYYDINDIGYVDRGRLYYIGKSGTKVRIKNKEYYANELEQQVVLKFHELSKCAILEYYGVNYAFVEGVDGKKRIEEYLAEEFGIKNVKSLRKIPRDVKHHTKINYAELARFCKGHTNLQK